MASIDLGFFDAGGGHCKAAEELKLLLDQTSEWQPSLTHLQHLLDPLDMIRMLTGVRMQDAYNLMLKKNWMRGASYMLPPLHGMIRVTHRSQVSLLESHWRASRPDLVVSLVPQFNRSLFESARRVMPGVPFVTILTDLADY